MMTTRISILIPLLAALACTPNAVPAPGDAASAAQAPRGPGDPELITMTELTDPSIGDIDALSAVRRLRPKFLTYRGNPSSTTPGAGVVQVSVDGGRLQPVESLTALRTTEIVEMRFLNASAAAQRFGTLARAGPVILVRRR